MATKSELQKQWEAVNNTLADLADLRCWPEDKDIAQVESELLNEMLSPATLRCCGRFAQQQRPLGAGIDNLSAAHAWAELF